MAQLFFIYGTMNSGKSIQLLSTAHSYREQGKSVLLLTPATDTRDGVGTISSRIGLSEEAVVLSSNDSILDNHKFNVFWNDYDAVLVDEAQFLTPEQVLELTQIVDEFNVPVMAYGLKNDFSNNLFPGSEQLLLQSDKLIEMKTTCRWCGHKATMNLRVSDGKPVYDGDQVEIGGNESYLSVCRYHYNTPNL